MMKTSLRLRKNIYGAADMRPLSFKTEPSPEQEERWTPDEMIETLVSFKDKPMTKVLISFYS